MMTDVLNDEGKSLPDVMAVLAALRSVGCRFCSKGDGALTPW
jgi:hypothetical protein